MTLTEINSLFETVSTGTTGVTSYAFGWPSDRTRSQTPDGDEFPRVLFAVPELTRDPLRNQDQYQVQLFFDDLLGYDNDGDANSDIQLTKWSNLLTIAADWENLLRSTAGATGQIVGQITVSLDSFASIQRLISVILTFTFVTNTPCGPTVP